jgi:hypothetical protein
MELTGFAACVGPDIANSIADDILLEESKLGSDDVIPHLGWIILSPAAVDTLRGTNRLPRGELAVGHGFAPQKLFAVCRST